MSDNNRDQFFLDLTREDVEQCFKYGKNTEAADWYLENVMKDKTHHAEEQLAGSLLTFCTRMTNPSDWDMATTSKFNLGDGDGESILIPVVIPASICNMVKLMIAKIDAMEDAPPINYQVVLQKIGICIVEYGLSSCVNVGTGGKLELMELLIKTLASKK